MEGIPARPLSENLGRSFGLVGQNLGPLALVALACAVPWVGLELLLVDDYVAYVEGASWFDHLVPRLLSVVLGTLQAGLSVFVVVRSELGRRLPWTRAVRSALAYVPGLVVIGLADGLFGFLLIPIVLWWLAPAALLLERLSPIEALKRSTRLVWPRFGSTLVFLLVYSAVLGLVFVLALGLFQLPVSLLVGRTEVYGTAVGFAMFRLVHQALAVAAVAAPVVWYLDCRAREERGLDVDRLDLPRGLLGADAG